MLLAPFQNVPGHSMVQSLLWFCVYSWVPQGQVQHLIIKMSVIVVQEGFVVVACSTQSRHPDACLTVGQEKGTTKREARS